MPRFAPSTKVIRRLTSGLLKPSCRMPSSACEVLKPER